MRSRLVFLFAVLTVLVVSADSALAQTSTMSGTATGANADTWNQAANWDLGVPSGATDAVIASGITALAYYTNTPAYSGTLTLMTGATVRCKGNTSDLRSSTNAISASTITMNTGSFLITSIDGGAISFPPIILAGNATVTQSDNWEDHETRTFAGEVSGAGQLTINGRNNQTYQLNTSNTFAGGLVTSGAGNWRVEGNAAGCFSSGDVTIGDTIGIRILAADAMADSATLYLNGGLDTKANIKLVMGADDTIGGLSVDGYAYPNGTYGRIGCPTSVDYEMSFISGDSVMTVAGAAADTNAPTVTFSGPVGLYATEPVSYTITFSEPHTPALTSNDLENAETSGIEILSFMPASVAADNASYEVGIKATSAGSLQLGIKSSVTITDLSGNPLGHPAADNDTLTVKPLPLVGGELGILKPYVNGGINPATGTNWAKGDQYRLLFVTTGETNANSTDIEYYNSFVQGIAATSTNYPLLSTVTWKVIGSTDTVDARDNTGTNPTTNDIDVAVIALDGITLLAENNADLWDGDLANPPMYDQNGSAQSYGDVATGTDRYLDGIAVADGKVLGGSAEATPKVSYGRCTDSGTAWIQVYNGTAANPYPYYALSEPLTIVSTAPKGTLLLVK